MIIFNTSDSNIILTTFPDYMQCDRNTTPT